MSGLYPKTKDELLQSPHPRKPGHAQGARVLGVMDFCCTADNGARSKAWLAAGWKACTFKQDDYGNTEATEIETIQSVAGMLIGNTRNRHDAKHDGALLACVQAIHPKKDEWSCVIIPHRSEKSCVSVVPLRRLDRITKIV